MRISDWSSDVCSSDLAALRPWRMDRGAGGRSLDLGNRDLCDRDQRREPGAYRRVRIAVRSRRPTLRGNLDARQGAGGPMATLQQGEDVAGTVAAVGLDRKDVVSGERVAVRVELGCGRIIE